MTSGDDALDDHEGSTRRSRPTSGPRGPAPAGSRASDGSDRSRLEPASGRGRIWCEPPTVDALRGWRAATSLDPGDGGLVRGCGPRPVLASVSWRRPDP